jgi:hypothetical protein
MLSFALDPYDFDYIESRLKEKKNKTEVMKEKIKEHDEPLKKDKKIVEGSTTFKQAASIDITPSRIQPPKKKKKNINFD